MILGETENKEPRGPFANVKKKQSYRRQCRRQTKAECYRQDQPVTDAILCNCR